MAVNEQECNHNCESCSEENCSSRKADMHEKMNEASSVKKVIGVVSGKGGVGKSMVTALSAVALNKAGYRVGILDADITGPSIPKMFGVHTRAEASDVGILPGVTPGNIEIMSLNLLTENETDPVIWRGPVLGGAVKQFWTDVAWGDLDVMLIDMPPGTGDVPLTVFQSIPVDGIIVVTSPQELVSMIVEKAVNMANMMNIPVLGVVENMSYLKCPECGKKIEVFGQSHLDSVAEEHKLEVIDKLPIDPELAELSDEGKIEDVKDGIMASVLDIINKMGLKK